nr:MAG TPA: hypothetical protein [Caudoviricetes sp.]
MAILKYDFDDVDFEFDVDTRDYFDNLDDSDACKLASEIYEDMNSIDQEDIRNEFGEAAVKFDPNFEDCVAVSKAIIQDTDEKELVERDRESVTDYFADDARKSYEDSVDYTRDVYGYYGVNEKDFY